MHFLEERIDELENQLQEHGYILRRLAKAIKPNHNENCEFNKALKDIECKALSNLHDIQCFCKNKHTHHKRCIHLLERQFEEKLCDCGFKEVKDIFGEF